jgi:dihydropteroate synthase
MITWAQIDSFLVVCIVSMKPTLASPLIMGILNCTPDSFFDGGLYQSTDKAIRHALAMQDEGAQLIDIGGESTRPGAKQISVDEELARIVPVIAKLKQVSNVMLSVDTSKPEVMGEVISLGVDMINDVNAFEALGALEVVSASNCKLCLMHKKGQPETMQHAPVYYDVVNEVYHYLKSRMDACKLKGIRQDRLILDVGFGFGKKVEHNLSLIKHHSKFLSLNAPLMTAVSRKSSIGAILNRKENERLPGSLALAVMTYLNGAQYFRVHDVRQTVDALHMIQATNLAD